MTDDNLDSYPEAIPLNVIMDKPNQKVVVYVGLFSLKYLDIEIHLKGSLQYHWVPLKGMHFKGTAENITPQQFGLRSQRKDVFLYIDNKEIGEVLITRAVRSALTEFGGPFLFKCVFGNPDLTAQSVRFSIPNLKSLFGSPIRYKHGSGSTISSSRISLENSEYSILIDKSSKFDVLRSLLEESGGFILLYSGEIKSKSGSISKSDASNILQCLQFYLTFINGSQTSPLFVEGRNNDEVLWKDCTDVVLQSFNRNISWTNSFIIHFGNLWQNFSDLWSDDDGKDFLQKIIYWYAESNHAPIFAESKIVLVQAGLELLFNWYVVERLKIVSEEKADKMKASDKIELLIQPLEIGVAIPVGLDHLDQNKYPNGPVAVAEIRNAIVHGNFKKRKKLNMYSMMERYQIFQLALWYLELSLLYILKYEGQYENRTRHFSDRPLEQVPWKSKTNH